VRKLAARAQWTIDRFEVDEHGYVLGVHQQTLTGAGMVFIPASKMLLFRTVSANNDPSGRSVLRNAYLPYHFVSRIQEYEAIAIERELNGLPFARIPSEYLTADAGTEQKAFLTKMEKILRDVKRNEQGFVILPSDLQRDAEGKLTDNYLVTFELIASSGTRDIDTNVVIGRHQMDIARSILADFMMLGRSASGSYALSESKVNLFIQAMRGYLNAVAAVLNRVLMERIWAVNGFDRELMPTLVPGDIAPVDLEKLGDFLQSFAAAGAPLFPDEELENVIRQRAGLPERPEDEVLDRSRAPKVVLPGEEDGKPKPKPADPKDEEIPE